MSIGYGIGNYLDISTVHITQETLEGSRGDYYRLASYDRGAFFWVPDEDWDEFVPDDLQIIFNHARLNACTLVRLDADGFQFPELEEYDWS